jgi:arylsulfatase A-like enzyme
VTHRIVRASIAVLGLLLAGCRGASHPPVILVTVDALRADRVGLYGGLATPHFDRVGLEGAVAAHAVAPFGRTTQSVGSILTGLHPLHHGADGLGMRLPASNTTLAERFGAQGYDTAAFITNIVLQPGFGFEKGFGLFSNPESRWVGDSANTLTDEALAWVRDHARTGERPFFLWIHYLDPHWPYEPSPEFARRTDPGWTAPSDVAARIDRGEIAWGKLLFDAPAAVGNDGIERLRRAYDAEVLQTDAAVGRLLNGLAQAGVLDRAVVLFASDHGESLGEHAYWFGHGEYIYEPVLRVPLAVRYPGTIPAGTRVEGDVQLTDIAPTLLDLAGLGVPPGVDGVSLAPALRAGGTQRAPARAAVHLSDHLLVRRENPRRPVAGREGRWWAVREHDLKLLRIPTGPNAWSEELYDLAADPAEAHDLARERAADATRLRERLGALVAGSFRDMPRDDADAPPVDVEKLRSLGYAH